MLWVTSHFQKQCWHVTYATVGYIWLFKFRKDRRLSALAYTPQSGAVEISLTLTSIFGFNPIYPVNWPNETLNQAFGVINPRFTAY